MPASAALPMGSHAAEDSHKMFALKRDQRGAPAVAEAVRQRCSHIAATEADQLSLELEQEILQQGRQAIEEVLGFMAHKDLSMRLNEVDKCEKRIGSTASYLLLLFCVELSARCLLCVTS
ncbi:MAG: hypothetical protein FRX49_11735 [Trebouxia sp. A1-2]|nr:MAG: hypothetical protein FRX49_11735 [Trebouxia sp. A1-2]